MNNQGIYNKFIVYRTDGKSNIGQKHHECKYFVLDLNHDKFAIPAIIAYAEACREEYPELSANLFSMSIELGFPRPQRKDGEEPCGECHLQPNEICDICGASWTNLRTLDELSKMSSM